MDKWLSKYDILAADDVQDLERIAARNQYHKGMAKGEAELHAYNDYKDKQLYKGAAFHLDGMKAAKENADKDSENKHYVMYVIYCKHLNKDHNAGIPSEIKAFMGMGKKLEKFSPHPADNFAMQK